MLTRLSRVSAKQRELLVRTVHPDLHPGASDEERRALKARFVEIIDAYRALGA